jgi:iron complex transport system permease protein
VNSNQRNIMLMCALAALMFICFLADLVWGSIDIPLQELLKTFTGNQPDEISHEILVNFRLPKAITAILAGASLSVAGLLMQTLFRNPLADPYILGVSSGAGLGVAITLMSSAILPAFWMIGGWGIIFSAITGAALVLFLVILVSYRLSNSVSLLIVGIMFGTIAGSIVSILQNFTNPDAIKLYVMWTFGSLSSVNWQNMMFLLPVIISGIAISILIHKKADGLLLGENYARGLGINIRQTRILIVLATGLLAGGITAFTGPIAFVGVAVPHISRGIFKTSLHKILIPASLLIGASLILICDIISQLPTYALPINTISALFGAPVIIWIILRK